VTIKRIESILYRAANQPEPAEHRSLAEQFAIPHVYRPDLSVRQALLFSVAAVTRIFLGSLLFALWGTGAALAWGALPNLFLRILVLVLMVALFLVALAALMLGISAAIQKMSPGPRPVASKP